MTDALRPAANRGIVPFHRMLQAHSFLWNYLWVAPNLLLFALGILVWLRGLRRQLPAFLAYAVLSSISGLALFAADVIPSVSAVNFWRIDWLSLSVETFVKFVAIGEIFSRVFNPFRSISKLGKYSVSAVGAVLVFGATFLAAISPGDSTLRLISGAHLLELTVYIVESGLVLFIFLLVAYFRTPWDRVSFGILVGYGVSSCVHLSLWAIMTNAAPTAHQRTIFDFVNMATFHVTVLIWYYFLLVPAQ
ncbi:MAG TPA: hypothetical protein VM715_07530, partial [Candidatus Acidoferrum sp.]|nr:hypothetical protein [Candidatus Acidoferrum sp.]